MIEQAVVQYLLSYFSSHPTLASAVGNHVFYHRVPTASAAPGQSPITIKMPWIRVTNSGGMPRRLSQARQGSTDVNDILTLYVADDKQFRGRQIADAVVSALHNYRGDMPPAPATAVAFDTFIRCGTTRDLDGPQDAYVYLITVYARYKIPTAFPN